MQYRDDSGRWNQDPKTYPPGSLTLRICVHCPDG
jgi:hypothetical protein